MKSKIKSKTSALRSPDNTTNIFTQINKVNKKKFYNIEEIYYLLKRIEIEVNVANKE